MRPLEDPGQTPTLGGDPVLEFLLSGLVEEIPLDRGDLPVRIALVVIATGCIWLMATVELGALALPLAAFASLVVIGERPGLSAADSLGIYLTHAPRPGRLDSERNCISNIRSHGLSIDRAAALAEAYATAARQQSVTGPTLQVEAELPGLSQR